MARFKTPEESANSAAAKPKSAAPSHSAHAAHATVPARSGARAAGHAASGRAATGHAAATTGRARGMVSQSTSSSAERMRSYHDNGGVRQKPSKAPKGVIIGIVIAAILVVILLLLLLSSFWAAPTSDADAVTAAATTVQAEATAEDGIEYHGRTYKAKQIDAGWALVATNGSEEAVLYSFEGEPVSIVFYEGMFYIAENLSDGTWDVISYMAMDGATATQLTDAGGNALTGTGMLTGAVLDGSSLVCTDSTGAQTTVALA